MKKILFFFLFTLLIPVLSSAQSDFNILYGPYLQNVTDQEATVVWVTNRPAVSWVEVAPDDNSHFYAEERPSYFETNFGKKLIGTLHKVKIKGLQPNTSYRYRIYSKEVMVETPYYIQYGKVAASDVYRGKPFLFTTLNQTKKEMNFIMVNDIHGDNELLSNLLNIGLPTNPEFVLFNGDMVSDMRSEEQLFEGFMDQAVKKFASETPMFFARGNHEARGMFAPEFINYFPTPTGQPYYSFRQGPVFFVVLDGGEDKPDSDIEYHGLGAFDIYRTEQVEWLKETLESEAFKSAPVKIAIMHVPPARSGWHGLLHVKKLFIPLLNEAGIDLMLSAHIHRHFYLAKGEEEGCDFPILINSNRHITLIEANEKSIQLTIKDEEGKLFKEIDLPANTPPGLP